MGVVVNSVAFNSELVSGSTDYLLGNVLNKVTATINISVGWFAFAATDNEFLFAPTSGYPTPAQVITSESSSFADFKNGDTFTVTGTTSNNGTYTITNVISEYEIRTASTLVNETSTTAELVGTTDITALNLLYNLVENSSSEDYVSAIDGSIKNCLRTDLTQPT